jgi:hypothetical protein
MTTIEHSLKFVTELDGSHPVAKKLLELSPAMRKAMLESMLKELLVPLIKPAIDKINEGGSYAILKVKE